MTLVYQQDDCAPDSFDSFLKRFQEIVGQSFYEWKSGKLIENDYDIIYQDDKYKVSCSADDPYWKIFQRNS